MSNADTTNGRLAWLDVARGFGMVLVVVGHAMVGVNDAGRSGVGMVAATDIIYTFHMPLFFLLSGLVSASLMRAAPLDFIQRVGLRTLYPYLLWSALFLVVHSFGKGMTNTQSDFSQLAILHTNPVALYWFLHSLLLAQVFAWLLSRIPTFVVLIIGAALIAAGAIFGDKVNMVGTLTAYHVFTMVGFYLIGQRIGVARMSAWTSPDWRGFGWALAAAVLASAVSFYVAWTVGDITGAALALPASFGATFLVFVGAKAVASTALGAVLASIGRAAMAIYVVHVMITGAVRIGLLRLTPLTDGWTLAAIGAVLGLTLPWIADAIAKRLKIAPLLGWR